MHYLFKDYFGVYKKLFLARTMAQCVAFAMVKEKTDVGTCVHKSLIPYLIYMAMTMLAENTTCTDAGADDGDGSLGKATFVQTFFVTGSGDSIKEVPTYVKGGGAAPNADVKLVSEMDAGDCEGILVELDKEVSIKKAHRKKPAKVLAVLMRAALDTAEVKKVRERVGFTTSNRASRARVLERPGPSGLRARASNGPPLCRAARARSLLTRMIEDRFVRI